jgi:hypothetical protein
MNILYGFSRTNKKTDVELHNFVCAPKTSLTTFYHTGFFLNYIITIKLSKHAWLHYTLPSLKNLNLSFIAPIIVCQLLKYSHVSFSRNSMYFFMYFCRGECTLEIYYTFEQILVGFLCNSNVPFILYTLLTMGFSCAIQCIFSCIFETVLYILVQLKL